MSINEKAWSHIFCLFLILRFRKDPCNKNKQYTPTPDMHNPIPNVRGIIHTTRASIASCFGLRNFPDFRIPKQAHTTPKFMSCETHIVSKYRWLLRLCGTYSDTVYIKPPLSTTRQYKFHAAKIQLILKLRK